MKAPFMVAEISASHNGSLDNALKLIDGCAQAGADAIKLQTWTPDTMVVDPTLVIESGPWAGRNMQELYREAHTPWEWHEALFERAKMRGMVGFSSVFDLQALDFLESINCPMYKIASFDCVDLRLIRAVAETRKPMVISTGMASWQEVYEARQAALYGGGCVDLTMLVCSSAYPAPIEDISLGGLHWLRDSTVKAGFSDHTQGVSAAVAAVALGASLIEKHVRFSDDNEGLDSGFACTLREFSLLSKTCRDVSALVSIRNDPAWHYFGVRGSERSQERLRKSLFIIKDMEAGDHFTSSNVRAARPALGLHCREFDDVIGKTAKTAIKAGTPLAWSMIS